MNQNIAKRYAKALIAATNKESDRELIEEELKILTEAYRAELHELFENPVFHPQERLDCVKHLGLSALTLGCLELLIRKNRTFILPELSKAYTRELDTKLGRIRAKVTSAKALEPEQLAEIRAALFKRLGKEVIPETEVHPGVLGGVRAQIGGLVFDGTLESQFSQLRRDLCN